MNEQIQNEQIQYLPNGKIVCERQVRDGVSEASAQTLSGGFKEVGQLQPIRVRKVGDKYVVVDGERRFRAAKHAGFETIAAIVESEDLNEGQIVLRQLIANCERENLKPMEKSRATARLMELLGWSATEAAKQLGISNTEVSNRLVRLKLPPWIQKLAEDGVIAESAGTELARVDDPAKQAELAQRMADGHLTRDGLTGERKATRRNGSNAKKPAASRATAVLDEKRSVTVSSEGLDFDSFLQILEELVGKVRKIRPRGIGLQTFLRILKEEAKA
jgi:ParB family chromosome partitioning protein